MNEKDEFVKLMLQSWQQQMQEYLNDPKTSNLLIQQYIKTQEILKHASDSFTQKKEHDNASQSPDATELVAKLAQLEERIYRLENIISNRN